MIFSLQSFGAEMSFEYHDSYVSYGLDDLIIVVLPYIQRQFSGMLRQTASHLVIKSFLKNACHQLLAASYLPLPYLKNSVH